MNKRDRGLITWGLAWGILLGFILGANLVVNTVMKLGEQVLSMDLSNIHGIKELLLTIR